MIEVASVFIIIYVLLILQLALGLYRFTSFKTRNFAPVNKFSVVIPFKNEKDNLPRLLESINELNYPKDSFEVILVDDDSTDGYEFSNHYSFEIKLIQNDRRTKASKKDAITTAIKVANYDWIVTTDADCLVNSNWLTVLNDFIIKNKSAAMICGEVELFGKTSLLTEFQKLDFLSLQATTIGSFSIGRPFMCNGANFAYKKSLFNDLDGFNGNSDLPSGDDVFLLQKALKNHSDQVFYLRSEAFKVKSKVQESWKGLFHQRLRWASKTPAYFMMYPKILGLAVLVVNAFFVLNLIGILFGEFSVTFCLIKFLIDAILLLSYQKKLSMFYFVISFFLYPIFNSTVGLYSFIGKYQWK